MPGIIFSYTNGGPSISSSVDHGPSDNGDSTIEKEFFLRHTYLNNITGVGFYLRPTTATYSGDFTAVKDYDELIAWGDGADLPSLGGFQYNFSADTAYPIDSWPLSPGVGDSHRTGFGDSAATALGLPTSTGVVHFGEVQTGLAPNVRFKMRIKVPENASTTGIRQVEQVMLYNYTS